MVKKVLVTGGAGFIGSHLVDALLKKGHAVRILDNFEPQVHVAQPDYLNKAAELIRGDVRSSKDLSTALKDIDVVFHFAAMVGVGQSMYQIERYTEVNSLGTAKLLEHIVSRKKQIEKLVIASSMSIYGEGAYTCEDCGLLYPKLRSDAQLKASQWEMKCADCKADLSPVATSEEKPLYPTSVYAVNKRDQEELCLSVGRAYNIPTVALRFFNTYGTRQSLSNPYTGVCAIFLSRIKNDQPPLIFEDGKQLRDFVSVHDIVQACLLAMEKKEADYDTFNVGTGHAVSIYEIAQLLIRLTGKNIAPVVTGKFRSGDIRHCYADILKIKEKLGYNPKVTLEKGMQELIAWGEKAFALDKFTEAEEELHQKHLLI
ncbi:MAG: NAD-dependent epimerase/dehydratase family protein [Dehalococcoidia bacterium]